jgi:hypothetical protein
MILRVLPLKTRIDLFLEVIQLKFGKKNLGDLGNGLKVGARTSSLNLEP